jgi:hypothetical protein
MVQRSWMLKPKTWVQILLLTFSEPEFTQTPDCSFLVYKIWWFVPIRFVLGLGKFTWTST